ncbi:hypothetical protein GQR58_012519 [Nymphon striatum]|nr:hypothetical protein GQR58_012519 [Nymphon striatum]
MITGLPPTFEATVDQQFGSYANFKILVPLLPDTKTSLFEGGHTRLATGSSKGYEILKSCHNRTSEKSVIFTNPSSPSKDTAADYCDLTIEVTSPDVCQIKVDFMTFDIDPPAAGVCSRDRFQILGAGAANLGIGSLCGVNTDQHIYIDVSQQTRPQTITLVFITDSQDDYEWKLKITQIDCKNDKKDLRGKDLTSCAVKYTASDVDWSIDTSGADKAKSGVGTTQCNQDYVILSRGSATGDDPSQDRYCGGVLNPDSAGQIDTAADVISKSKGPIIIRFHTDGTHETAAKDGFRLTYEQINTGC